MPTYGRNWDHVPSYIQQVRGFYDPLVSKYTMTMMTPHSRYRYHSGFWASQMLRPEVYQHHLWINAADAMRRGINDGDTVEVFNDKGKTLIPAFVTNRVSPGVVMCRLGGWFEQPTPGVNLDISGCPNSLAGEPDYANNVVEDPTISAVNAAKATTVVEVQPLTATVNTSTAATTYSSTSTTAGMS